MNCSGKKKPGQAPNIGLRMAMWLDIVQGCHPKGNYNKLSAEMRLSAGGTRLVLSARRAAGVLPDDRRNHAI